MLRIGYARTLRTQRIDHGFAYALHLLELWRNELISCDVAESEAGLPASSACSGDDQCALFDIK